MPLEFREEAGGGVIALRAPETLSRRDLQRYAPEFDRLVRTHGTVGVLLELPPGFRGWDTGAAWEAVKLGLKHAGGVGRIALVGEPNRTRRLQRLYRLIPSSEVRCFGSGEADEARAWLRDRPSREPAAEA